MLPGKEGVPTVSVQVIVDHSTRVLAVSPCYPGTHTDISIARLDLQVNAIRFADVFVNFAFLLLVAAGVVPETVYGVYLIADGGYQYWRILQQTNKLNTEPQLQGFLAQVASSRKDVECTF